MKRKIKRRRREGLVYGHMSRAILLQDHFNVVRRYIGKGSGIYVLCKRDRLMLGFATALSGRLKAHLRDHSQIIVDRFSIYVTIRDQHMKELESFAPAHQLVPGLSRCPLVARQRGF